LEVTLEEMFIQSLNILFFQELRDPWKPNVTVNFLDQLLTFVKANVKEDNPRYTFID